MGLRMRYHPPDLNHQAGGIDCARIFTAGAERNDVPYEELHRILEDIGSFHQHMRLIRNIYTQMTAAAGGDAGGNRIRHGSRLACGGWVRHSVGTKEPNMDLSLIRFPQKEPILRGGASVAVPNLIEVMREREEKYAKIFQSSPSGIVITLYRDGRILEVNDTFTAVTGYTRDELIGFTIMGMGFWVRPEDRVDIMECLKRTGSLRNREVRFRIKSGRILTCQLYTQRLQMGGEDCLLTSVDDITEQRQVEEALRKSEERLRLAMKAADAVVWDWDVVRDVRTWCAGSMAVFGWHDHHEQEQNEDWWIRRVHPEDAARVAEAFNAAVNDPGCFHWQDEYRFRKGDGDYAHVLDRGDIIRDGAGRALRMTGAMHDESRRRKVEEELRRTRERLQLAVEGSSDGIWDWDLRTNALYLSPRWKGQLGYSDEELANEFVTFESRLHPEERERVLDHAKRYLAGLIDRYEIEFRLRHQDGSYRWILGRGVVQRNQAGEPYRMAGSHTDITERKRAEEKYQTLFRTMLDGFALHEILCDEAGRPVDYRFLAVNPAFERMTGYRASELVGRTVLEMMPGTERRWIETYGRVALTGEPVFFEEHAAVLGKDFEVTAFRPAPGQFASVFVDITERKRAEESLREKARELEVKNRHLECLFTLSHLIEHHGEQVDRILSLVAETVRATLVRPVPPVVEIEVDASTGMAGTGSGDVLHEFRHPILAKGERRGEIRAGRPLSDPPLALDADESNLMGAVAEHLGRLVERWDAGKAERERQLKLIQVDRLTALGMMVAGVAHEINNPLNVILLNASLFRDFLTDVLPVLDAQLAACGDFSAGGLAYSEMRASVPDLLRGILDGSERIKSVTIELRNASLGRGDAAGAPVEVNQAVVTALHLCSHMDKHFKQRTEVRLADSLPSIWGDRHHLEQVLVNLFRNAWQSLRRPEARIHITTGIHTAENMVVVQVRDEGCGMSSEVLAHIKEPFFTTRRDLGGMGLGLPISNNIIQGMGGRLEYESAEGKGTTARIRLPVMRSEEGGACGGGGERRG